MCGAGVEILSGLSALGNWAETISEQNSEAKRKYVRQISGGHVVRNHLERFRQYRLDTPAKQKFENRSIKGKVKKNISPAAGIFLAFQPSLNERDCFNRPHHVLGSWAWMAQRFWGFSHSGFHRLLANEACQFRNQQSRTSAQWRLMVLSGTRGP